MLFQHQLRCFIQSCLHSLELCQNIDAIFFVVNHAYNRRQVPLSFDQTGPELTLCVACDSHAFTAVFSGSLQK
jgi:hypothetical protein